MTSRTRIAVFSFLAVPLVIIGTSAFAQIPGRGLAGSG